MLKIKFFWFTISHQIYEISEKKKKKTWKKQKKYIILKIANEFKADKKIR